MPIKREEVTLFVNLIDNVNLNAGHWLWLRLFISVASCWAVNFFFLIGTLIGKYSHLKSRAIFPGILWCAVKCNSKALSINSFFFLPKVCKWVSHCITIQVFLKDDWNTRWTKLLKIMDFLSCNLNYFGSLKPWQFQLKKKFK